MSSHAERGLRQVEPFKTHHLVLSILSIAILYAAIASGVVPEFVLIMTASIGVVWWGVSRYLSLGDRGRKRARICITVVSTLIAVSPFFSGHRIWIANLELRTLQLRWAQVLLAPFYFVGSKILELVDVVLFCFFGSLPIIRGSGEIGSIRRDSIFAIWLAIAVWFGSALLIEEFRRRQSHHTPSNIVSGTEGDHS